jgi:hypothetical protein
MRESSGYEVSKLTFQDFLERLCTAEAYRVLKQNRVAFTFYGWTKVDKFFETWLRGPRFAPPRCFERPCGCCHHR